MRTDRNYGRDITRLLAGVKTLCSAILPISSNMVPNVWEHVTKVDPEPSKQLPLLFPLYLQHTDAISVGGSSQVTGINSEEIFYLLDFLDTPSIHEPSEARHVTDLTREKATMLAIPEVLNGSSDALVGTLGLGIEHLREELVPSLLTEKLPSLVPTPILDSLSTSLTAWLLQAAAFEAYIIQNPESAAAKRGGVSEADVLSSLEAKRRALAADLHLGSEIVYIEYSGTFGGEEAVNILNELNGELTRARVWYGGGIDNREKATAMLDAGADSIVVGNIFHRIAREETHLYQQVQSNFTSAADHRAICEWLDENQEIQEMVATKFLSTIPTISEPEAVARDYMSYTLGLRLLRDTEMADTTDIDSIQTQWSEGYTELRHAIGGSEDETTAYISAISQPVTNDNTHSNFPIRHLSFSESGDDT